MKNIDSKFHPLIFKLEKTNLYLLAVENPKELENLSSELIELGKYLIIKRIESQKVYMEKLFFMLNLIKEGDISRVSKFTILKYVRFCIEVSILSLNIYNKSVFVTKMEEASLKLKSIVINKPKLCEVEFPFVVVYDTYSLTMLFCISRGVQEIKKIFISDNSLKDKRKVPNRKSQANPHELLKPKEKVNDQPIPRINANIQKENNNANMEKDKSIKNKVNTVTPKEQKADIKKKQFLKVLMMQKEKMFFSMNQMCETFENQTDILKMFLIKNKPKVENVKIINYIHNLRWSRKIISN